MDKCVREKYVKGSITVEMAYVFPVIMLVFIFVIYTTFYYHDKNVLKSAAAETAVVGAQKERQRGEESTDMEAFYQERIKGKLIFLHLSGVEVSKDKKEVRVEAYAEKGRMRVSVCTKAGIPGPEKRVRIFKKQKSKAEKRE